jgi:hypothetical protein
VGALLQLLSLQVPPAAANNGVADTRKAAASSMMMVRLMGCSLQMVVFMIETADYPKFPKKNSGKLYAIASSSLTLAG